jgi:hypothetical protein
MGYNLMVGYLTAVKILETFLLAGLKPGRLSINAIYDSILNSKNMGVFIIINQVSF